ncbi:MAG: hypothetical protein KDJ65_35625, partial [Anaerolineae bacterium]|nr:hypothetical protein [Anaerolineae bacterium]
VLSAFLRTTQYALLFMNRCGEKLMTLTVLRFMVSPPRHPVEPKRQRPAPMILHPTLSPANA